MLVKHNINNKLEEYLVGEIFSSLHQNISCAKFIVEKAILASRKPRPSEAQHKKGSLLFLYSTKKPLPPPGFES